MKRARALLLAANSYRENWNAGTTDEREIAIDGFKVAALLENDQLNTCEVCERGIDDVVKEACESLEKRGEHPGGFVGLKCPHCGEWTRV